MNRAASAPISRIRALVMRARLSSSDQIRYVKRRSVRFCRVERPVALFRTTEYRVYSPNPIYPASVAVHGMCILWDTIGTDHGNQSLGPGALGPWHHRKFRVGSGLISSVSALGPALTLTRGIRHALRPTLRVEVGDHLYRCYCLQVRQRACWKAFATRSLVDPQWCRIF